MQARSLSEARDAMECMREHAAKIYLVETGRPFSPVRGSRVSSKSNASMIEAHDYLAGEAARRREQFAPQGRVGCVLVVEGAGSVRRALVGGNLATAAGKNGWAGIVVDGAVRDLAELRSSATGVRALALTPLRTEKRGEGQRDLPVQIQGIWVRPGDWLYADEDGIVVSDCPLHG